VNSSFERRNQSIVSDMGYRDTDKKQIVANKMKFLDSGLSADLYKVMSKINQEHIPIVSLSKSDLYILFYGHIFTNSVDIDGSKRIAEDDMKIYSEIMSECFYKKYSDVETFFYQQSKDVPENAKKDFLLKTDVFRAILKKFERILGQRDKI
jgi:hypothetical protein